MLCPSTRSRAGGPTSATAIGPVPAGQPVAAGGGVTFLSVTTAVGVVVLAVEPSEFVAVTRIRIVFLTSGFFNTYVFSVAPLIAEQLPPSLSQRCHW